MKFNTILIDGIYKVLSALPICHHKTINIIAMMSKLLLANGNTNDVLLKTTNKSGINLFKYLNTDSAH